MGSIRMLPGLLPNLAYFRTLNARFDTRIQLALAHASRTGDLDAYSREVEVDGLETSRGAPRWLADQIRSAAL